MESISTAPSLVARVVDHRHGGLLRRIDGECAISPPGASADSLVPGSLPLCRGRGRRAAARRGRDPGPPPAGRTARAAASAVDAQVMRGLTRGSPLVVVAVPTVSRMIHDGERSTTQGRGSTAKPLVSIRVHSASVVSDGLAASAHRREVAGGKAGAGQDTGPSLHLMPLPGTTPARQVCLAAAIRPCIRFNEDIGGIVIKRGI